MSRTINVNETITSDITGYDESDHSYYAISSAANGYDGSSSTDYASINLTRGSRAESYVYWEFTLPEVPAGATIESITCNYKARVSNSSTSYISAATIQLYSGTTAKGSSESIRTTSTSVADISSPGTWTAAEVNAGVRLMTHGTRGTSRTTSNYYIYFYGADISITYSLNGTAYEITATSNVSGVTISPASQEVIQGGSGSVTVSSKTDVVITDNGNDVTSSFVSASDTLTAVPQSQTHSGLDGGESYSAYAVGYSAEDPNSSTGNMYAASGSTGYVDYSFDFSAIPSGAVINDVEVRLYGKRESSSTDSSHMAEVSLYSGSTKKGTEQEFTSTSNYVMTLDDIGTWTADELHSAKVRFTVAYYGGGISGISWEVTYEINGFMYTITNVQADHTILVSAVATGNTIMIKSGGQWKKAQKVFVKVNGTWQQVTKVMKKTNGSWVQSSDISDMFQQNSNLMKG